MEHCGTSGSSDLGGELQFLKEVFDVIGTKYLTYDPHYDYECDNDNDDVSMEEDEVYICIYTHIYTHIYTYKHTYTWT